MMTRYEMNKIIRETAHPGLLDEIEFRLDVDREPGEMYDEVCALIDATDMAECERDRKLLTEARKLMIAIGFYRVMPQEEINRVVVSSGTAWDFKMNRVAYTSDHTYEQWRNAVCG